MKTDASIIAGWPRTLNFARDVRFVRDFSIPRG